MNYVNGFNVLTVSADVSLQMFLVHKLIGWLSMPKDLTPLANVEQLSERVVRILGQNPGAFTLQGTNTFVVGTGAERLLVDTGDGNAAYSRLLTSYLESIGVRIGKVIVTHRHADHIGGVKDIQQAFDLSDEHVYKYPDTTHEEYKALADGDVLSVEGATVRVIYTPGHTKDHIALLLEEEGTLFSGDCVLGGSSTVFEHLGEYLNSIHKMKQLNPLKIYPGHGVVIDGRDKVNDVLDYYVKHRLDREAEIYALVSNHPSSVKDITGHIYPNVSMFVRPAAERGVALHLEKLWTDGRIRLVNGKDEQVERDFADQTYKSIVHFKWAAL
jgi:glyoxylase-like metal-dependent hydrolase (beta-lactamase superfamily II)